MSTNAAALRGKALSYEMREALVAVNGSTATALTLKQSNLSLSQKQGLELVRAGGTTRAAINALPLPIDERAALCDIAGV